MSAAQQVRGALALPTVPAKISDDPPTNESKIKSTARKIAQLVQKDHSTGQSVCYTLFTLGTGCFIAGIGCTIKALACAVSFDCSSYVNCDVSSSLTPAILLPIFGTILCSAPNLILHCYIEHSVAKLLAEKNIEIT
jgi:hypothetical protein